MDNIRDRLNEESITDRCRKTRPRWFGHVKRRDQEIVGRSTTEMVPHVRKRRGRGRPKQRWMAYVNRNMIAIGAIQNEVHARAGWMRIVSTAKWYRIEEHEHGGSNLSIQNGRSRETNKKCHCQTKNS